VFRKAQAAGPFWRAGRHQRRRRGRRLCVMALLGSDPPETKGKDHHRIRGASRRGVEFLHVHESPLKRWTPARRIANDAGRPAGLDGRLRKELQTLGDRLTEEDQRIAREIDTLRPPVIEALKRAKAAVPRTCPPTGGWHCPRGRQRWSTSTSARPAGRQSLSAAGVVRRRAGRNKPELTLATSTRPCARLHDRGPVAATAPTRDQEPCRNRNMRSWTGNHVLSRGAMTLTVARARARVGAGFIVSSAGRSPGVVGICPATDSGGEG